MVCEFGTTRLFTTSKGAANHIGMTLAHHTGTTLLSAATQDNDQVTT